MLDGFEDSIKDLVLSDEIRSALISSTNGLAQGLVDKNAALLGKIANNKDTNNATSAELEALKVFKQSADVKAAEDAKSYDEAKALTDKNHADALLVIQTKADSANEQLKTLLIDNGLSNALDNVKINKDLKAGAIAMLKAGAIITDGKAMIGEQSLSDAVIQWAKTDAGKAFCLAENNIGGNGLGGDNNNSSSNKDWGKMSISEKAAYLENK